MTQTQGLPWRSLEVHEGQRSSIHVLDFGEDQLKRRNSIQRGRQTNNFETDQPADPTRRAALQDLGSEEKMLVLITYDHSAILILFNYFYSIRFDSTPVVSVTQIIILRESGLQGYFYKRLSVDGKSGFEGHHESLVCCFHDCWILPSTPQKVKVHFSCSYVCSYRWRATLKACWWSHWQRFELSRVSPLIGYHMTARDVLVIRVVSRR